MSQIDASLETLCTTNPDAQCPVITDEQPYSQLRVQALEKAKALSHKITAISTKHDDLQRLTYSLMNSYTEENEAIDVLLARMPGQAFRVPREMLLQKRISNVEEQYNLMIHGMQVMKKLGLVMRTFDEILDRLRRKGMSEE